MILIIILCIINLGLSGAYSVSTVGELNSVTFSDGTRYTDADWMNLCLSSPYVYLRPFSFVYSTSDGYTSVQETYCGFSASTSTFRFVIGTVGVVITGLLFFKTPLSIFARMIWGIFAFLYFTVFVLDANDTTVGYTSCQQTFPNTDLGNEITGSNMSLTCDESNFAGVTVIDLFTAISFFILHTSWALCKDLYIVKK